MSRLPLPLGDSAPLSIPTGRDYNFGILSLGEEVSPALAQKLQSRSRGDVGIDSRCSNALSMSRSEPSIAASRVVQSPCTTPINRCSYSPSSTPTNMTPSSTVGQHPSARSGQPCGFGALSEPRFDPSRSPTVQNGSRQMNTVELPRTASIPTRVLSGLTVYEASPASGALKNLASATPVQHQIVRSGSEVILHVYDLDRITKRLPGMMAFYHMGLEVFKQEIFFSVEGILACKPGGHQTHIHKKTVHLGRTMLDAYQVKALLEEMGKEWQGKSYSLTGRNCQTFAVAFAEQLGLGRDCIPSELHWKWDVQAGGSGVGGAARGFLGRMLSSKSGSGSKATSK